MYIAIEHVTRHDRRRLGFELDPSANRVHYAGLTQAPASYTIFSYDEERDLVYRTPFPLSPVDLEGEVSVHFPEQLIAHLGQTPLASSLGHLAMIQPVLSVATRISPIAAMRALLERIGDVNTAVLAAENGGLLFVREAAGAYETHASAEALERFVSLKQEEREQRFPDFDALEVIVLGSDALTSDPPRRRDFGLEEVRTIRAQDVASFLSSSVPLEEHDLIRDGLAIAAATLVLDIMRDVA